MYTLKNLPIVYQKEHFVVYRKGQGEFLVHNTKVPFNKAHSHVKSRKFCEKAIDCVLANKFPYDLSYRQLGTLVRLSLNKDFKTQVEDLRKRKHRKNKQKYKNTKSKTR